MNEFSKLKWQCRRGSLELDLLLEQYMATRYLLADEQEKRAFSELLKLEDEELQQALRESRLGGSG